MLSVKQSCDRFSLINCRERRLLMPPFHSERMRTYGSDILSLLISA
ncbi:hypothetical protein ACKFKG_09940 [Phormidesmis sp. 146-35]